MKSILTLAATAALVATQSTALSCMPPDVAQTFQWASEAEESYAVLLGKFSFDAPPQQPVSNDAQPQEVVASFTGQGLAENGFAPTTPTTVTLRTSCAGPWCGGFPNPDSEMLAFVALTDDGYLLTMGPCGGSTFGVDAAPIVEACMRGEVCTADPAQH
ncbi:hypothetical protein Q4555_08865 [Octadecabacter sp. 1_MG-2023]|uniref:hypothetical protein n=1 Tax=unclassified Octadecabacter TaxID=196158 RepID=UPI001C09B7CD|nr:MULTISPECIES: hypothetical protein [unclassified Octadecabacter]MBU2992463.1 hypothetical protein [Octadecabacter sp. B2R22]MDO6734781.1 hypothetical protein [Octadecabacter sp. 1_MG-2023]